MKSQFVADGETRLHQALLDNLQESIRVKYAAELAEAGFFHRLVLRSRIAAEFKRELRRNKPSKYSLYGRAIKER